MCFFIIHNRSYRQIQKQRTTAHVYHEQLTIYTRVCRAGSLKQILKMNFNKFQFGFCNIILVESILVISETIRMLNMIFNKIIHLFHSKSRCVHFILATLVQLHIRTGFFFLGPHTHEHSWFDKKNHVSVGDVCLPHRAQRKEMEQKNGISPATQKNATLTCQKLRVNETTAISGADKLRNS